MSSPWNSFIPHHVAQDLLLRPDRSPLGQEQRMQAVALFADVAGFTALSELLGAQGKDGTEELTQLLNSYFQPIIELISAYGGIIGKFGGDAITVVFPYQADDKTDAILRACACAVEMQACMREYQAMETRLGNFSLSMKCGLAAGPVFCTTVGEPESRLEYILAGDTLDRCAQAEHLASQGQIILDQSVAAVVQPTATLSEQEAGWAQLLAVNSTVDHKPVKALAPFPEQVIQLVKAFLHPSIARRIEQDQLSFLNEHRKVTILFAGFSALDYEHDPQVGARLQAHFADVILTIARYDGYLNKIDMGDKGSKYIVLFGAPIAHENDAERALQCALELQHATQLPTRIGINTGFVFSGQVGSPIRREYTVMGEAVNLAARLMQASAPGEILVSQAARQGNENLFSWATATRMEVKGKKEAIWASKLLGSGQRSIHLQEPRYQLPMIGRKDEFARICKGMERARRGQGQIIGITADAGMGKSRLAAEVIGAAADSGWSIYGSECLSHATTTSYFVWRNLLRAFFALETHKTHPEQIQAVQSQLQAIDAHLVARLPLLGLPLNLSIPDNELTRNMDARLRKESLEALILTCLRVRAQREPLCLVLEDCHWIDPLSNDLLETIGRAIANLPVFLLTIYRPSEREAIQPHITRFAHFQEVRLAEFSDSEARQLIDSKLERLTGTRHALPDEFVQRISERAQGNPFYIDEIINLIHDRAIDLEDPGALRTLELPDSLYSLIISRIDQISESAKTALKVASVIGRAFRASWIWGTYPQVGLPQAVIAQLDELSRLDITPLDKPEPELEYVFKHIITRQVAYDSLALATRKMLHRQLGLFLEENYADRLDRFLDLLAYHFSMSADHEKQRLYLRKAGDAAQAAYANDAAMDYYQRLLPLVEERQQSPVLVEIGKVLQLTGKWEQAEAVYQQALQIACTYHDLDIQAHSQLRLGSIYRQRGIHAQALTWLDAARQSFGQLNDAKGSSDTIREIGNLYWSQGDYQAALENLAQAQNLAEAAGDPSGQYRATGNIGLVHWYQGESEQALKYFRAAQTIAQQIGDQLGSSAIAGNMGNVYFDLGDHDRAYAAYQEYYQTALELGYRQGVAIAVGNLGNIYAERGDYPAARL
ncbi:MAG: tetratricopeptide repeat protein, partial [Anaerolineales bacterium]|nr:tetratricopeptide repeat protein [Anaerolineales bacterium]